MMTAMTACLDAYKYLEKEGTYPKAPMLIRDFFSIMGLEDSISIDKKAGGGLYSNGV